MTEQTGNNKPNEAEGLAFPLSGNEKLIESVRDWPTITRMSHSTQLEKLVELRDALEAAEKALTPTDDEREALVKRLEDEVEYRVRTAVALHRGGHGHEEQVTEGRASIARIAAGFRRSEAPNSPSLGSVVPEPTTDDRTHEFANMAALMGVPEPSAMIECPHWSPGRITLRKGCTACEASSEVPEPQGEPSSDDRISRAIEALSWRPDHAGDDPDRVQDDYMRRAQSADAALAILTENREGAF